jgi:hypothetical protein
MTTIPRPTRPFPCVSSYPFSDTDVYTTTPLILIYIYHASFRLVSFRSGQSPSLSPLIPSTELIFFFLNEYVETYHVEIRQPHPMFRHRGRKPFAELFSPLGLLFLKLGYRVSLTPLHLTCFV